MNMTKKAAKLINGGLSNTSKMACKSYGLPAKECTTGSKLRKIEGSVCSDCYALKGMYFFPVVQAAQYKRLASITSPEWVESMVASIGKDLFFRWHDSGDIQTVDHLRKICAVAEGTPSIKHWLPTRETGILKEFKETGGAIPSNLIIRLSATMVNGAPGKSHEHSSTVHTKDAPPIGEVCYASKQGGQCLDCRSCWNSDIRNISYEKH